MYFVLQMVKVLTALLVAQLLAQCYFAASDQCNVSPNENRQHCQNSEAEDENHYREIPVAPQEPSQEKTWLELLTDSVYGKIETVVRQLVSAPSGENKKAGYHYASRATEHGEEPPSVEELMLQAKMLAKSVISNIEKDIDNEMLDKVFDIKHKELEEDTVIPEGENIYEYPPLFRRVPGKVGDITYVDVGDGEKLRVITKSVNPPIFEVPDFITGEECDYIVEMSEKKGLEHSRVLAKKDTTEKGLNTGIERRSYSTFLKAQDKDIDEYFMEKIYNKISRLLLLPIEVIRWSEPLAIGRYTSGGYYHAHLDSSAPMKNFTCCFQITCLGDDGTKLTSNYDCCRICRYATVLYYLSDVEEGGETSFPLADKTFTEMLEIDSTSSWQNLSKSCHDSPVVIKPKKGNAIFWYNHSVDKHGYLGNVETRSYHGGCDVIKGTKWIATNWITTPLYSQRFLPSKFRKDYDSLTSA